MPKSDTILVPNQNAIDVDIHYEFKDVWGGAVTGMLRTTST